MTYENCAFQQLMDRSREAGVEIQREGSLAIATAETAFAAAPIAGLEGIPATELAGGVDVGFARLADPDRGIEDGFYVVHAQAEVTEVGLHGATVALRDSGGGVVQELDALLTVRSMGVPIRPPFERTRVSMRARGGGSVRICFVCPNGWVICWWRISLEEAVLDTLDF